MTKQEWLIHILNGGKGTSNRTNINATEGQFVYFKDGNFCYNSGNTTNIERHTHNFAKYKEPKKMIKVAPYVYKISENDRYVQTAVYFKDALEFLKIYDDIINFKRLTALEIEVEDYEQN